VSVDSIKTVAVLGAGTMGNGIAHVFARAGYKVLLRDVEQRFLDRAVDTIAKNLGIVRGITVRSRSVVGNLVGGLQSIFGGQIAAYLELAETSRQEAFDHMCAHATQAGANAVVGMRYDANEIMDGITEVLAYGTAVWVEPLVHDR